MIMLLAVFKIGFMFSMIGDGLEKEDAVRNNTVLLETKLVLASEEAPETEPGDPEQVELSSELDRLRDREEELDRRARSLDMLEKEIDEKLLELGRLEARLEKMLEEADVLKDQKIRHLVDVYANMRPQQAAEVLETLDENISVKILAGMRGRQAGDILTHVNSRKAARLSELLTEMQTPFID